MNGIIPEFLSKPAVKFYKRRVLKDPFSLAIKQWKKDRGSKGLRFDYPLTEKSVVLDVGGYLGDFAQSIVQKFGSSVLLFEPVPRFSSHCQERFLNDSRVSVFPYGLGAEDAELEICLSSNESSFFRDVGSDHVKAQVRDIRSVWRELNLDRIDLIKVNIEGGEYPLIPRFIESGLINDINHLQIQFHDFVDDASAQRDEIRHLLSQTHTENWCHPFVWESWSRKT